MSTHLQGERLRPIEREVGLLEKYFHNPHPRFGVGLGSGGGSAECSDTRALLLGHLQGDRVPTAEIKIPSKDAASHIKTGRFRVGFYSPGGDGNTKWVLIDLDSGPKKSSPLRNPLKVAQAILDKLQSASLTGYLEKSGGGHGWHIWVFFTTPIPCRLARRFGLALAPRDALLVQEGKYADPERNQGIEVFPKQFDLKEGMFGNYVWLPWWNGATDGANNFYSLNMENGALELQTPTSFETVLREHVEGFLAAHEVIPAKDTPAEPSGKIRSRPQTRPYQALVAPDVEALREGCFFFRNCDENRENLSEPQWYALAGIFAHIPGGRERFHGVSQGYSGYNSEETDAKFDHATTAIDRPRNCEGISKLFDGCPQCPNYKKIHSPIDLGITAAAKQAMTIVLENLTADLGLPFVRDNLLAALVLKKHDPAEFARIRPRLKEAGVRLGDFENQLKQIEREKAHTGSSDFPSGNVGTSVSSQATLLVAIADERADLFHTPDEEEYAAVTMSGHKAVYPVKSQQFRKWLIQEFRARCRGSVPGSQGLQDALAAIAAKALYDGEEHQVHLRVASTGEKIYVDLCNENWEVVEIDAQGWRVSPKPPVRFRRTKDMLPLPNPVQVGVECVEEFRSFFNVASYGDFQLVMAWLVGALHPNGPFLVLVLYAEQGAGKSTFVRMLRSLLDPHRVPLRREPRNSDDLLVSAKGNWLMVIDNMSYLHDWLSDDLCRLATGGGISKRSHYTNDEEYLLDAKRPIILNGIDEFVVRGDLADRSVILNLPKLSAPNRKREKTLWEDFEKARPRLIGTLFNAISTALKNQDSFKAEAQFRMADAWHWAAAAETALGWERGTTAEAYSQNRIQANDVVLNASQLTPYIRKVLEASDVWEGTAEGLLAEFDGLRRAEAMFRHVPSDKGWPRTPKTLSDKMRRLAPALGLAGIAIEFNQTSGSKSEKHIILRKTPISCDAGDATRSETGPQFSCAEGVAEKHNISSPNERADTSQLYPDLPSELWHMV